MILKYIQRPPGRYNGDMKESSAFHLISFDGKTSVCNQVVAGKHGFQIVETNKKPLRTRTCITCRQNKR